ncbi:MAG: right-handed parallel beta-helix repeat-containing protein, partial [Saprospiraceae bacterium]
MTKQMKNTLSARLHSKGRSGSNFFSLFPIHYLSILFLLFAGVKLTAQPPCPTPGETWTARTAAEANQWAAVTYGNGLFVAVALDGANRVMTSPDGITWTARTAAEANQWYSVTYGNGLFVAVANTGTNRVMTSPDGITWTARMAAEANNWLSVTYGNGLFVAVANTGTNRVMTSPDGITWTARTAAEANEWLSVTYGNGQFIAVATTGTNRVMTSPDGITWTARTAAEANQWYSVTHGNSLFITVALDGTNRVMTSPDGITWTARTAAEANNWRSVTYGNGLFMATATSGTNRVMTSPDGITWTARTAAEANSWRSVTYGNGLFVATAFDGTNRVMTSYGGTVPTVSIASDDPDNTIPPGTSVTFTATPTNGGSTPAYQWKKNGTNVGTDSDQYTDATLANGDIITCVLTSSDPCASPTTASSNGITMSVCTTGSIWYVDAAAASGGNGASWACAFQNLQDAINAASSGHQIWVKAGTYKPTKDPFGSSSPTDPRDKTFYLKNGVKIYGGFDGGETMLSERDWAANVTILSGDLNGDDVGFTNNTENAYHVLTSVLDNSTTELDGFTVTGGNGNGTDNLLIEGLPTYRGIGGGMENRNSSPTVSNCIFTGNAADGGGAMYNIVNASPALTNCVFSGNSSTGGGGAMFNNDNCNPTLTNCVFSGNSSNNSGGALWNQTSSSPMLTNCVFSGNKAAIDGGAVLNISSSAPVLKNCIIWNNRRASTTGSASGSIFNISSTPVISYSLIQNQNPSGTGNLNGTTNAANSNYPAFITPLDPITAPSTGGNFSLAACSPVIDLGDATGAPTTDILGNARVDAIFGGGIYDLGAYEYQSDTDADDDGYQACTGFDCNDNDASINPGATETVDDGIDQNCNGGDLCYKDADNDGYRPDAVSTVNSADLDCADSGEAVSSDPTTDCDDNCAACFPGATEICDNKDNDCDTNIPTQEVPGSVWFVDIDATTDGNGASWACASQDLQQAINDASSGHEIWVAAGTYKPTREPDGTTDATRDFTFLLKDGVKIFGGFDGSETMRSERDWVTNVTTLSGDLNGNDVGFTNNGENAHHVVVSVSDGSATELDGFTITGGNANGSGSITVSPVTVARFQCGGFYNTSSSPSVRNCTITGNSASSNGGGVFNSSSTSSFTNCTFSGNSAGAGGGMFNQISSDVTLTDCVFAGNTSTGTGGGTGGGGIYITGNSASVLTSCLFSGNTSATTGGGIFVTGSVPTLTNCTVSGNRATSNGGGMRNESSANAILTNCIIWNNRSNSVTGTAFSSISNSSSTPVISYSLVQGQTPSGTGNLNGTANAANSNYPGFTTPLDPASAPSTGGNFSLTACSPVIDLGDATGAPTTDILGNARVDAIFGGGIYDIGAHEYQSDADADDDGYQACTGFDCNDNDAAINPGATEIVDDGIDQNCDGGDLCYKDADNDGYRPDAVSTVNSADLDCADSGEAVSSDPTTDCDDTNANSYPGATEICDNKDNDCDTNIPTQEVPGSIWYVDIDATTDGNGASWACASQDLQQPMTDAATGHEVWVAAGTYKPTTDPFGNASPSDPRDRTFYLKAFVKVYGGFTGTETMLSERDWKTNVTTLSGDLGTANVNTDNSYHVVLSVSDGVGTELNGFTIEKGNATGSASITVESSSIARNAGGGLYCGLSNLALNNCIISGNSATLGGGLYSISNASPTVSNCFFYNNTAETGGGVRNNGSSPVMSNCVFSGNSASTVGGGMANSVSSNPALTNCTFSGNNAGPSGGGGIYNSNASNPILKNCIIWNNRAATVTGSASSSILNSSSSPVISYSLIQNQNPSGTGNLNGTTYAGFSNYPAFVTPLDPTTAPSAAGDFHITSCSPGIEAGTNTGAPATDLFGNARPFDTNVDLGVHEFQGAAACPAYGTVWYVDAANTGCQLGTSWDCAFQNLQDAINIASSGHEIWVKAGTYLPTKDAFGNASPTDPRDKVFHMKDGVKVFGGFDGTETMRSERDFAANVTTLSGDFNGDDSGFTNNSENAYRVVLTISDASTTQLDGFTIRGANANGSGAYTVESNTVNRVNGAGLFNANAATLVQHCTFVNNNSGGSGGGMYNGSATGNNVVDCLFSSNRAISSGGAVFNASSSPTFTNCTFTNHDIGGGVYNQSCSATFTGCTFSNNHIASGLGGGMRTISSTALTITDCVFSGNSSGTHGGGLDVATTTNAILTNCLISGNSANFLGGGINSSDPLTLVNCTITGNHCGTNTGGGGVIFTNTVPVMTNCIIWNNR